MRKIRRRMPNSIILILLAVSSVGFFYVAKSSEDLGKLESRPIIVFQKSTFDNYEILKSQKEKILYELEKVGYDVLLADKSEIDPKEVYVKYQKIIIALGINPSDEETFNEIMKSGTKYHIETVKLAYKKPCFLREFPETKRLSFAHFNLQNMETMKNCFEKIFNIKL